MNGLIRFLFVLVTLVAYVVTKIGATLYAGDIILNVVAGMTIWQSTPLILIATASYTVTGGLTVTEDTLCITCPRSCFVLGSHVDRHHSDIYFLIWWLAGHWLCLESRRWIVWHV